MDALLVTPIEAARVLGVSRSFVYKLMSDGSLESVKLGKSRRIPSAALRDYVEHLRLIAV